MRPRCGVVPAPKLERMSEDELTGSALIHGPADLLQAVPYLLGFHPVDSPALVCFSKLSPDGENAVVVVVNLDPVHRHGGWVDLDPEALGLDPGRSFQVHDLLTDQRMLWGSTRNFVELDPWSVPAAIFRLRRKLRSEVDFDYFL